MNRFAPALALLPLPALAADAAPPVLDAGTVLQMVASLALVLAAIVALAWLLRRLGQGAAGHSGMLRVIASASLGQKERVVVVELADTWLVLGVAPGQVSQLHVLPRQTTDLAQSPPSAPPFAEWLKRAVSRHETPSR